MKTDRDFAHCCVLFLGSILVGALLFALISCGTLAGAGHDLKEAAPWIPAPYGTVADILGTTLVLFAGHKTYHHVKKRRQAKSV